MTFFCRCLGVIRILISGSFFVPRLYAKAHAPETLPFQPGEEIHYDVKWQMYKAGEAVVRVLMNRNGAWQFELKIKTNPFLDKVFKVRDHLKSRVAPDFSTSLAYSYAGKGKKKKDIQVKFLKNPARAVYSNFGGTRDPINIPGHCFDPLSSFYKMRSLDLPVDATISFDVTDGKKTFVQKGDVLGKEQLTLASGTWDTRVIAPWVTHFSGVFEQSDNPTVKVWITDDDRKIPVRIRIRVVVGSIYFDLNSYVPGTPGGRTKSSPGRFHLQHLEPGCFPAGNALIKNPGTGISVFSVLNGQTGR